MDPKTISKSTADSEIKNEKKEEMANNNIEMKAEISRNENANGDHDNESSGNSTDSEELVNAINYNTITSLAALKDIIQGDSDDTTEADSFFQHYFMNHCNNLSSRNSNSASPFPVTERRRLSQCREEDEDDEKKDCSHHKSKSSAHAGNVSDMNDNDTNTAQITNDHAQLNCKSNDNNDDASKRTVMGAKHKFLVTKTEPPPPPVARALRTHHNNAHTVHFGTKGAEEQRPNIRSIFAGQNLHRDKNYFDSSLIEIRSTVDGLAPSSEDIWVKRTDEKRALLSKKASDKSVKKETIKKEEEEKSEQVRARSGTWGAQSSGKEREIVKKIKKEKEVRRSSVERRQKIEQRLDAAITRSTQSVGERKRRGSADDGQAHPMYQQTIHGTSGVSRRPALFDMFKSRPRDTRKQPSIMQQVKAAVQSMTKSTPTKTDLDKTETPLGSPTPTTTPTPTPTPSVKARDGSAHPHPGSDTRYYHTVTASASRRPSAMAKVMDIFRGRASVPGQPLPSDLAEKRRIRAISQQQQYAAGKNHCYFILFLLITYITYSR